jgi:methylmalonyl-CoA mutase
MGDVTADAEPWQIEGLEPATEQQWRAAVNAVLARRRGDLTDDQLQALFEKVLTTTTDDGIVLQPLYGPDDAPRRDELPGQAPFVRGGTASGPVPHGWDIRQRVVATADSAATNRAVLDELANGSSSIWLDLDGHAPGVDLLDELLADVRLEMVAVALDAGPAATEAATALLALYDRRGLTGDDVRASLGFDPIGRFAASGGVEDAEIGLASAADVAAVVTERFPRAAALVADGTGYHNAGASEADELALALATGTAYLRTLVTAGLDVDEALAQVDVRLAATDNQFLTMAKLRAARAVFARVAEVAGASSAAPAQRQHAVTSAAMLTRYDPWVNLLRTTVAGFAAGVGGADAVTVHPHDLLLRHDDTPSEQTALSTRLARNVSTILIMESHLARVLDPAAGSWFVERLTDDLATRAWSRFQQVEAAGGIVAALEAGLAQSWLAETRARRDERIAHGRQPVTGVSEFPNLADTAPPTDEGASGPTPFPAVVAHSYAEGFERLRDRAAAHEAATGTRPAVFLATLGPLAEHTTRATFTTNLFAAGGIAAIAPGPVTSDSVAEAFQASGAALACICGADARYAEEAVAAAEALAAARPARLYLAGNPGDLRSALDEAGVDEYVVAGGDAVDVLARALDEAGVQ